MFFTLKFQLSYVLGIPHTDYRLNSVQDIRYQESMPASPSGNADGRQAVLSIPHLDL